MTRYSVQPRDRIFVKGYRFLKSAIHKTGEATGDLIGNNRITKVSKTSPKNNSETNEEEVLREIYISSKWRQKIIDDLRLKERNYWWYNNIIMEKNIKK